jgi:hypothetical protein
VQKALHDTSQLGTYLLTDEEKWRLIENGRDDIEQTKKWLSGIVELEKVISGPGFEGQSVSSLDLYEELTFILRSRPA